MNPLKTAVSAARQTALLFNDFPRGILCVRGADRARFLHNLLSHDIKGLKPQQGRHACLLDRHGKIRFSCLIHCRVDEFLMEFDPRELSHALLALQQYLISESVELSDVSRHHRLIPLHGPAAEEILRKSWPSLPLPRDVLSHEEGLKGSGIFHVVRWDLFRVPGYFLWTEPAREEEIRQKIGETGRPLGLEHGDSETFEILRIESGVPWPGAEIEETVILNELGRDDWVSFTKGCFVGQEIVARIKYRAHPPRLLKGFFLEGTQVPPKKSPVELEGKTVGLMTSGCFSPTLNRVVALGFLNFGVDVTDLLLKTANSSIRATATELPF